MNKELSKRKQKILQALVDEYITSAEPVSSSDIRDKCMPDVSSATIRSELAALEEMGYLVQPHTSAGRVPLPAAYKLYVEKLMPEKGLTVEEVAFIKSSFDDRLTKVEDIIKQTAKIISDLTNYTSVIVVNNFNEVVVKEIKLVPIGTDTALVIVITDSGVLKDKTIEIPANVRGELVNTANVLINKLFSGKKVNEILQPMPLIEAEMALFKELFEEVIEVINNYNSDSADKVYMDGELKMLDYPEYNNIDDAKNFLTVIGKKDVLRSLLDKADDIEFSVRIGKDESAGLDKCAVVTAKYVLNGKEIGQAGVIGPERMDYNKVISVLNCVSKTIGSIIEDDNDNEGANNG